MEFNRKIKCVKDEISRREKIYPLLVEKGKLDSDKADLEIEAMRQVLQILTQLKGII